MEVIRLSSYTETEKFQIAKEHLIPENLKKHNLTEGELRFEDQSVKNIIRYYTREAGVRELNRRIEAILRKFVRENLENKLETIVVNEEVLFRYLKKKEFDFTDKRQNSVVGVVTGLA
jgi:ATP-dependent Lon protease